MTADSGVGSQIPVRNVDPKGMRQVVCFAIIVVVSFWGMVVMRETGRRSDETTLRTAQVTSSTDHTATISTGETVKIEDHLAKDKWTIVQFTAHW
jgi:hypothetical protein